MLQYTDESKHIQVISPKMILQIISFILDKENEAYIKPDSLHCEIIYLELVVLCIKNRGSILYHSNISIFALQ